MSDALKSSKALTELDLGGEGKRKKRIHKRHLSTNHSVLLTTHTGNKMRESGGLLLGEALKSNTTLAQLDLGSENKRKKRHKRHPSTIHSFAISSYQ